MLPSLYFQEKDLKFLQWFCAAKCNNNSFPEILRADYSSVISSQPLVRTAIKDSNWNKIETEKNCAEIVVTSIGLGKFPNIHTNIYPGF